MCSNARSPSGSRTRWAGSRGRADRRPEGRAWHPARDSVPGAGGVPVLVLQAPGRDAASRRILGFGLGEHHDAELAYGALAMAVAVRGGQVPGVVFHTDQGSEYTAGLFRAACARLSVSQSMGRPGSALDNAVIESWHSTVEFELRRAEHFTTRAQARARVAAWIEEYNTTRRHSACGMMPPVAWELARGAGREAA